MKNLAIKLVLSIVILFLGYLVVDSIRKPVQFKQERLKRSAQVINRLKEIRDVEMAYKAMHFEYCGDFDTLVQFINEAELPVIKMIPDPEDTTFTRSIRDTIAYIGVKDSIFRDEQGFSAEDIMYIPFSNQEKFTLEAAEIERNKVKVQVFHAYAKYKSFLGDLDEVAVNNFVATQEQMDKFPGIKVGSITEPSTDGNWE